MAWEMIVVLVGLTFGQGGSAGRPPTAGRSLFADIKAHEVGDIVTVLIVETARATRESQVQSAASSDVSAQGSVTGDLGSLIGFLPSFGASSGLSNSHQGSEGTQQREMFTGKISAVIVETSPDGMLKIQGERTVEVNGEKNVMRLEGLVRPRDIRADNTVYSYNIANAAITYRKSGTVNRFVKPGTVHKWIAWLLGIGLVALAVVGT